MAIYNLNLYRDTNIYAEPDFALKPLPVGRWPAADHLEASSKVTNKIHFCEMLTVLKRDFNKTAADLVVGDLILIDYWPSMSALVAAAVNVRTALPGLQFSVVTSATTQPTTLIHSNNVPLAAGGYTVTSDTATPTALGATSEIDGYMFTQDAASFNGGNVGAVYMRVDAIPAGGIALPNGGACSDNDESIDINFRLVFNQIYH